MKSRFREDGLPTPEQLKRDFEGIPADPRTGYPAGYVSFSVELDARLSEIRLADGSVHRVRVQQCPTRWANGASRQLHGRKRNLLRA